MAGGIKVGSRVWLKAKLLGRGAAWVTYQVITDKRDPFYNG